MPADEGGGEYAVSYHYPSLSESSGNQIKLRSHVINTVRKVKCLQDDIGNGSGVFPSGTFKGPNLSCELKMLREQSHTSPTTPPPPTPSSISPSLLRPNHPVAVVAGRVQLHPHPPFTGRSRPCGQTHIH